MKYPSPQRLHLDAGQAPVREPHRLPPIGRRPGLSAFPPPAAGRPDKAQNCIPTIVVDKSTLCRAGLVHILANTRFRIVADGPSLSELLPKSFHGKQALLLLDLGRDANTVPAELSQLRQSCPDLCVIMLGDGLNARDAVAAIGSGGTSYLEKDGITPDVLLRSLELALLGTIVVSGGPAECPADDHPSEEAGAVANRQEVASAFGVADADRPPAGLSGRERLILSHVMQGASNKHIARDLGIAEATVKVHVKSLLRKIRVRNRTQAAMWGVNHFEIATVAPSEAPTPIA